MSFGRWCGVLLAQMRQGAFRLCLRGSRVVGVGTWRVLVSYVRVGVAAGCGPHAGGTLATEGCSVLVEPLVFNP